MHFKKLFTIIIIFLLLGLAIYIHAFRAPSAFPKEQFDFHIEYGNSLSRVSQDLYDRKIISSKFFFKIVSVVYSKNKGLLAGDYRFDKPENVVEVARRLVSGDQRMDTIRITIPEGTNVADMAFILLKNLPDFNAPRFVSLAKNDEGYLYPDTYDFYSNVKPEDIIKEMKENFNSKIATISKDLESFGKTTSDIIIMSSLVEKEAKNEKDRKIIAGILWKRLKIGMLLQVDAPFYYLTGKTGGFTNDDLKIKSKYNTYLNKGLPIGPISNPGLITIVDTINPITTPYYYYLTGNEGLMYYAETYDGHLRNKNKYLK